MRIIQNIIRWAVTIFLLFNVFNGKIWAIGILLTLSAIAFETIARDERKIQDWMNRKD